MGNKSFGAFPATLFALAMMTACGDGAPSLDTKNSEMAHAIGDLMGSLDETMMRSGGGSGAGTAGSCLAAAIGPCSGNQRRIHYDACRLGPLSLEGSVDFVFENVANCGLVTGALVRRLPNFLLQGRSGGTLGMVASGVGSGQSLSWVGAQTFSYAIANVRRYLTDSANKRLVDLSIRTPAPMQITSSSTNALVNRAARVLSGGSLEIADAVSGETLTLTPQALKWASNCSCAVSGSWTGQVVHPNAATEDFVVEMRGCGNAELKRGTTKASLRLERCLDG